MKNNVETMRRVERLVADCQCSGGSQSGAWLSVSDLEVVLDALRQQAFAIGGSPFIHPLDLPLPCAISINGHVGFGAGVKLRTLVEAASRWHGELAAKARESLPADAAERLREILPRAGDAGGDAPGDAPPDILAAADAVVNAMSRAGFWPDTAAQLTDVGDAVSALRASLERARRGPGVLTIDGALADAGVLEHVHRGPEPAPVMASADAADAPGDAGADAGAKVTDAPGDAGSDMPANATDAEAGIQADARARLLDGPAELIAFLRLELEESERDLARNAADPDPEMHPSPFERNTCAAVRLVLDFWDRLHGPVAAGFDGGPLGVEQPGSLIDADETEGGACD